jgi:hypothetical protein
MAECTTSKSQNGPDQDGLPLAAADSNGTGATSVAASLPLQPSYGLRRRDRNHDGAGYEKSYTRELESKHKKRK